MNASTLLIRSSFNTLLWCMLFFVGLSCPTLAMAQTANSANDALGKVAFDQNLGQFVPGDVIFNDAHGEHTTLKKISQGKPVFLVMGYFHCKLLCDYVIEDLADTISRVPYTPGKDYQVVFISIDPKETPQNALAKRNAMIKTDQQNGWHMLTGDKHAIDQIASAIGFKYAYDASTNQFAHPAGAVMLTSDLKISRYLFGIRFAVRDVKFALIDSSNGKVGTFTDQLLLRCYCYDPVTGKYGMTIVAALDVGGGATVVGLVLLVGMLSYKHRRQKLVEGDAGSNESAVPLSHQGIAKGHS